MYKIDRFPFDKKENYHPKHICNQKYEIRVDATSFVPDTPLGIASRYVELKTSLLTCKSTSFFLPILYSFSSFLLFLQSWSFALA